MPIQGIIMTDTIDVRRLQAGTLKLEVYPNSQAAGSAAARAVREALLLLKHSTPRIGAGEADFEDPQEVKIVKLDQVCRQQQLAEGWFQNLEQVPERAITLTIPTILRVPKLIVSVPGPRKANIVRQMLAEPISTACPATILRTHPDATVYLDDESAAELKSVFAAYFA
jgi:Glucosamine-6-phosphate isomerases/6-phosphogluconolactonase